MSGSTSDDKRPSRVLDHLFIGSRAHAKNRGLLKELGINRILNVTPPRTMDPSNGVPNFFEKDRSMTYKRVAVFDNRGEDILQHLDSCISFIEQGRFYGKVLVHCNKGVSRSSTVVAAYLMSTRGLSKDAAMIYLRARRPVVNPHEGFMSQLEAFEVKLNRERAAAIADGQAKKFPNDLLETTTRTAAKGPSIGPIGPPRGPSGPSPAPHPKSTRNPSPIRGPPKRTSTAVGPSPNRASSSVKGPVRGPSPPPPASRGCERDPVGPSPGPLCLPSANGEGSEASSSLTTSVSSLATGAPDEAKKEGATTTKGGLEKKQPSPTAPAAAGGDGDGTARAMEQKGSCEASSSAAGDGAGAGAAAAVEGETPSKRKRELGSGAPEVTEAGLTPGANGSPSQKTNPGGVSAVGPAIGPPGRPRADGNASNAGGEGKGSGGGSQVIAVPIGPAVGPPRVKSGDAGSDVRSEAAIIATAAVGGDGRVDEEGVERKRKRDGAGEGSTEAVQMARASGPDGASIR